MSQPSSSAAPSYRGHHHPLAADAPGAEVESRPCHRTCVDADQVPAEAVVVLGGARLISPSGGRPMSALGELQRLVAELLLVDGADGRVDRPAHSRRGVDPTAWRPSES
jgi:hypothetical protein